MFIFRGAATDSPRQDYNHQTLLRVPMSTCLPSAMSFDLTNKTESAPSARARDDRLRRMMTQDIFWPWSTIKVYPIKSKSIILTPLNRDHLSFFCSTDFQAYLWQYFDSLHFFQLVCCRLIGWKECRQKEFGRKSVLQKELRWSRLNLFCYQVISIKGIHNHFWNKKTKSYRNFQWMWIKSW